KDERRRDLVGAAKAMQRKQSVTRRTSFEQVSIGDKFSVCLLQSLEYFLLRFPNKSTVLHSGIGGGGKRETAVAYCQEKIVDHDGNIENPSRPELPLS